MSGLNRFSISPWLTFVCPYSQCLFTHLSRLPDSPLLQNYIVFPPSCLLLPPLFISSGCLFSVFFYQHPSNPPRATPPTSLHSALSLPPLPDHSCFIEIMRRSEEGSLVITKVIGSSRLSFVWRTLQFSVAQQCKMETGTMLCQHSHRKGLPLSVQRDFQRSKM